MSSNITRMVRLACCGALLISSVVWSAQNPGSGGGSASSNADANLKEGMYLRPGDGTPDNRKFNPRDFNGNWRPSLYGYGSKVPEFTPEGQKRFDANKPSYGLLAGSPEAKTRTDLHIGRRRAVQPAFNNDITQRCNPLGLVRLLVFAGGMAVTEMVQVPTHIVQRFEWTWDHREIWTDGRPLPNLAENSPRWNGYSVGRWEGDTLVVETIGLDDRQWLDHFGYPVSAKARLIERWRRVNYSSMELRMTLIDPLLYKTPFESDVASFRLVEAKVSPEIWNNFLEDRCVPLESDPFYEEVVKPVSGAK